MTEAVEARTEDLTGFYLQQLAARVPLNHAMWRASEAAALASWPLARPVLDVGCGDGTFARMVLGDTVDAGLDLLHSQIERAAAGRSHGAYIRGSLTALPFRSATFQSVLSNCVLEHVPDVDLGLTEIARVLRPGGHLAFTVPTHWFPQYLLFPRLFSRVGLRPAASWYVSMINGYFRHHHIEPPESWTDRCSRAGLRVVDQQLLMPRRAVELWDALMPLAALQVASQRLGRRSLSPERWLAARLLPRLSPMLGPQQDEGGNIAFLAVRE